MTRVAVTGIGVVAPGGIGRGPFWDRLSAGRTATRRISSFDPTGFRSQVAAECDFDPQAYGLSPRQVRRCDRMTQFALVAAHEAMHDSGLELSDAVRADFGVSLGSAVGATITLENEYLIASNNGREWLVDEGSVLPYLYQALVPSSMAAEVAADFELHGPAAVVSTGCTSGIDSIGRGLHMLEDGDADFVLAGASDAPISPISVAAFDAIRATTDDNDDPARASRPFDLTRSGFVLGEGAAVLLLEKLDHALARGTHIYCEIGGYASRCNGYHMTGLRPDGLEMSIAIRDAMGQARLDPGAIDYISAHGSGTKQNDRHETAAFKKALGAAAYEVPISSIKSMVGHSLGAIGSIEMAACALAIDTGVIPPTANWNHRDPECDLDYVPNTARAATVDTALSVGSGFGGFQSAMVFTRPEELR
ncbi:beta-ketoacyl-[acyl-carrier-protein] synthase family protein [Nocardia paucivorans]|uniref:beta-ketoacyl-[acyl-carrier-protein] synthase family protein n=1 Tax=Nocardia paucivorans TaxID=114259 RepID=UPI0002DF91E5|nr:beta-ketoacyl-[acyl-carrier-protein] synthase family protein [Nocardia paucivorans]